MAGNFFTLKTLAVQHNPTRWQQIVADYFTFTKGRRRAAIFLLVAIVLSVLLPAAWWYWFQPQTTAVAPIVLEEIATLKTLPDSGYQYADRTGSSPTNAIPEVGSNATARKLFRFDPNTATTEQWQQLGLRDKTIHTIQNYLSKGGHFYKATDLGKIYGLRPEELNALLPYVAIAGNEKRVFVDNTFKPATYSEKTKTPLSPIDINTADTAAFIRLPGIGSKLASRIVNFREKLGGFYSTDQVGETYGVPDSTFQKIKPYLQVKPGGIRKRNINSATADELRTPYIPYNVANAIVKFREHNGSYQSVEDLKKIPLIDEPLYEKIAPYLTVD